MSTKLEEWLERMQAWQSDGVGNAASIHVTRSGRDVGWIFEINAETKLPELVDHIDSACRDSGFAGPYELRAYDKDGKFCGPFKHTALVTEIVPNGAAMVPAGLETLVQTGLQTQTAMTGLALKGLAQSQRYSEKAMDRLEKENSRLSKENETLRQKLVSHWDTIEKLNTHELETKEQTERVRRMGSIAETAITALIGRLTGKGDNAAAQTVDIRLMHLLFRNLQADPNRLAKIFELLGDDERMAIIELSRRATEEPEAPTLPDKPNGLAAASAAAATNGKGN